MKNILLISLSLLFSLTAMAQSYTPISFEKVTPVNDNPAASDLYSRAKNWVVKVYNDPKKVIQMDDSATGQITVNGIYSYGFRSMQNYISYQLCIYVKDGRYKYEMGDLSYKAVNISNSTLDFGALTNDPEAPKLKGFVQSAVQKLWTEAQTRIKTYNETIIESLNQTMSTPTSAQNDNW